MDHLWSPWRLEYVTGAKPDTGCIFCEAPRPPHPDSLIVHQRNTCYVILNRYPYNNGHLMIVPYRHVASFVTLTPEERHEIADLQVLCERALVDAYQPQGMNVGVNLGKSAGAGVLEHVHVHFVPRWTGDTSFMGVVGETRVLPEDLQGSAARLKPIFERLAATP